MNKYWLETAAPDLNGPTLEHNINCKLKCLCEKNAARH